MKSLFTLLSVLILSTSFSQLITYPSGLPYDLNQNILMGPDVSMSNVSHSGDEYSISFFTANGTNLQITQGIHMNTGTIFYFDGRGPQGPNNQSGAGFSNTFPGNSLLTNLINGTSTHNASVLEFDFVPNIDTIRLNYIFGSDEFPEYVGSTYNDVFAIFISGPGISGQQNIAKLSSSSNVSINAAEIINSIYYVNNGDGSQSPYNQNPIYIQYDGYTKALEAFSPVQSGQTYHMIIAIADAGDGIIDSGVFIETQGLNVGLKDLNPAKESIDIFPNPTTADANLKITLPKVTTVSYVVINTLGQQMESDNLNSMKEGVHTIKLNTGNYSTGVYFVKVKIGESTMTQKVIVK